MNQPNAQNENHDNPYAPYTQDRQNWDNQLEQLRERERQERDQQTCTQQIQDHQKWQNDHRAPEAFQRNEATRKKRELQARNLSSKTETPKTVPRPKSKLKTNPQPKNQIWSNPWALIGMVSGGVLMYSQVKGMENPWWTIGFAAVFLGFLTGRFYKIIVLCLKLAIVLALGLVILNLWVNRDPASEIHLPPKTKSSWNTVEFVSTV